MTESIRKRRSCTASSTPPPLDPMQRYTVPEACRYLRLSRSRVYLDIRNGTLATIRDGSRRYIPGHEIVRKSRVETEA